MHTFSNPEVAHLLQFVEIKLIVDVEQDVRALVGVHVDVVALGEHSSRFFLLVRGRVVRAFLQGLRGRILIILGFVVIRPDPLTAAESGEEGGKTGHQRQ